MTVGAPLRSKNFALSGHTVAAKPKRVSPSQVSEGRRNGSVAGQDSVRADEVGKGIFK